MSGNSQDDSRPFGSTTSLLVRTLDPAQSEAAWTQFVERYYPLVFACVFRRLNSQVIDDATANDITQEVFKIHRFLTAKGRSALVQKKVSAKHWIFTIAKNATIDHLRSMARRAELTNFEFVDEGEKMATEITEVFVDGIIKEVFEIAKTHFGDQAFEIITRYYMKGESGPQIAKALGVSEATVYRTLDRIKQLLRSELAELGIHSFEELDLDTLKRRNERD